MTKAEMAAYKAYPYETGTKGLICKNSRQIFIRGYEQAEKDLALTLEQVVKLDNIIMSMVYEGYNDGYKTRPFYEEVLRRFNEQRNEGKS